MDIVGLIPAGGVASRLGKLPCSKEILPAVDGNGDLHVASENLIRYFRVAGIREIYFIIRKGKWDIPAYYGDGSEQDANIGYLIMNSPFGVPFTLSQAYPFVKDKTVALGFPDIVFNPEDAFAHLKDHLANSGDEIVLGIVPCSDTTKVDMVVFDERGKIKDFVIKQNRPDLKYSWFVALWKPVFTQFLKDFTDRHIQRNVDKIQMDDGGMREIYIGDVIIEGIRAGIRAGYVLFDEGQYEDIGTPGALNRYVSRTSPGKKK